MELKSIPIKDMPNMINILLNKIIGTYSDVTAIDELDDMSLSFQFENCTLAADFGKYKCGEIIPCVVVDLNSSQLLIVNKNTGNIEETYELYIGIH